MGLQGLWYVGGMSSREQHGLWVRVTYGTGTGYDSPTREPSNEPKNVIFGQGLREL